MGILSGILMAGQLGSVKKSGLVDGRAEIHLFPWLLGRGVVLAELSRDTWEQRSSLEGFCQLGWNPSAVTCIYLGGGRTCLCHILGVLMPWDSVNSCSNSRWLMGHWREAGQAQSSSSSWRCCGGGNQPVESNKRRHQQEWPERKMSCAHTGWGHLIRRKNLEVAWSCWLFWEELCSWIIPSIAVTSGRLWRKWASKLWLHHPALISSYRGI